MTLPRDRDPEESLFQVLAGAREGLGSAALLGGHTTEGESLAVGFAVWGFGTEATLWRREGLRVGDQLLLSAPLGSGVAWRADMSGGVPGPQMQAVIRSMMAGHDAVLGAIDRFGCTPSACTDVTGFGLARHLLELVGASEVGARLFSASLPTYDGALRLLDRGVRSTLHDDNRRSLRGLTVDPDVPPSRRELLFDPQTCGPMLLGMAPADARRLIDAGVAWGIGEVVSEMAPGTVHVVNR